MISVNYLALSSSAFEWIDTIGVMEKKDIYVTLKNALSTVELQIYFSEDVATLSENAKFQQKKIVRSKIDFL